jgi:hypothetical protein
MQPRKFGAWLAVFAMVSQVLFGAAHAAALAAAAFGPLTISQTPNASFGLLQICTANGLIRVIPNGPLKGKNSQQNSAEDRCHVCASASASPFIDAPAVAIDANGFVSVVNSPPQQTCALVLGISRAHPIRAPPRI